MKVLQRIAAFGLIAVVIIWLSGILKSDYLAKFLEEKIVELLITLMAINVATAGIIVSKLDDVSRKFNIDLSKTIEEVKKSVIYQLWFIVISIIALILFNSKVLLEMFPHKEFFDVILLTVFICALDILRDTGLAIFSIDKATRGKEGNQDEIKK